MAPHPAWTRSEVACVLFVATLALVSLAIFVVQARAGEMRWGALKWHMISRGLGSWSPKTMAIARLAAAMFVIAVDILATVPQPQILSMFTNQTWTLMGIYFILAGAASAADAAGVELGDRAAGALGCITWALFEAMLTCAILIFAVVWLVLLPVGAVVSLRKGESVHNAHTIDWRGLFCAATMHNANMLLMVFEASVNRLLFVPAHAVFVFWYGTAYIMFSWVWFLKTGVFWYFFIDWRSPFALLGYLAIGATQLLFFFVAARLCAWLKQNEVTPGVLVDVSEQLQTERSLDTDTSDFSDG